MPTDARYKKSGEIVLMPRIRSIHPGIWTDEEFVGMSMASRLLFIGILNECDDQGVFIWKPTQLKMRVLPSDSVDVADLLSELTEAGFIRRYAVNGSTYGAVRHFREFQRPKKPNAVHPLTDEMRAFSGTKAECHSPPVGNPGGNGGEAVPGEFPQEDGGGGEGVRGNPPYAPPWKGGPRGRGSSKLSPQTKDHFTAIAADMLAEPDDDTERIVRLRVGRTHR
jgi:hypothetical protein